MYEEFEVLVDFKDSQPQKWILASLLSDGLKSVLNIVSEIAFRYRFNI